MSDTGVKEMLRNFYKEFFNGHDENAALKYVREDYRQHNPGVGQGRASFMEAFARKFREEPEFHLEIVRIIAEDDFAAVYLKNVDGRGQTKCRVVDIYRIRDHMVAEHWDVLQPCKEEQEEGTNEAGICQCDFRSEQF